MKCGKVKNPCKICFESVSNKNGVQCKGACKKWAHFKCLNYTPGKISDIKAGLIQITCPCPDCTTSEPKEFLTNPPLKCTNKECPATRAPSCEVPDCPSKDKPIPKFSPLIPISPRVISPKKLSSECIPPEAAPKCPTPPKKPCPSPPKKPCPSPPRRVSPPRQADPCPPISPKKCSPPRQVSPPRRSATPPLKITIVERPCPSCPTHCPKRSGSNTPCQPSAKKSNSCSLISAGSNNSGKTRIGLPGSCSSDSALLTAQDQKVLCSAIEQMCDTVGQLSCQIRDLLCKMKKSFQKTNKNRS